MNEVVCSRCGIKMEMVKETESSASGEKNVRYWYKCPACGKKDKVSSLVVKPGQEGITIEVYQ